MAYNNKKYGPDIEYNKGPKNMVTDVLSRLELKPKVPSFNSKTEKWQFYEEQTMTTVELQKRKIPISYEHIHIHQDNDKVLKA